jgi:hypothetical protein
MIRPTVLLVAVLSVSLASQGQTRQLPSIDEYNVPKEVDTCIKHIQGLSISGEFNPFYLSGDFDGDGKLDFAVQVVSSGVNGILFCLSSQKAPLLVGAGSSLVWPASEKWRFDAWSIVPKDSTATARPTKAKHDAILLDIKETANGLLYWDGSNLRWEQLGD